MKSHSYFNEKKSKTFPHLLVKLAPRLEANDFIDFYLQ